MSKLRQAIVDPARHVTNPTVVSVLRTLRLRRPPGIYLLLLCFVEFVAIC